jgi:AcrR family transcriptional regulator
MTISNKKQRPTGDKVRSKILKSAKKLFAKQGFTATTTAAIAKQARVNQSLIFHHFGNKGNLWQAIKAEAMLQYTDNESPAEFKSFKEFLYFFVRARLEARESDQEIVQLLEWQRLESKALLKKPSVATQLVPFEKGVEHLQKIGEMRKDFAARDIITMCMGLIDVTSHPNVSTLYPDGIESYVCFLEKALYELLYPKDKQ